MRALADEPPAVAENRPAARARAAGAAGSAAPSRPSPSPSPSAEDSPPPAAAAPARRPDPPAKPKPAATSEVDDMLSALDGKPAGGGGGAKPAGAGAAAAAPADPMLPDRLDRRQILTVVKQNAGAVAKCKSQPPGSSGTVMVKMQISGNGSVSEADASGPLKGTAQGNCIERTVKVFRFPQFSGPAMQINMPFSL
ncbi:MAG: AgmX/PglI C-terminal domain-containing protein [Myxococcales bacterium]|nr:AgmX/PglI C-terminal domain-containing protein [Myxococcales bacterium]